MEPPDVARLRESFKEPHELVRTSDGKVLFMRRWGTSSRTDLAVVIFHGMTAYSEPYGRLIGEELARSDIPVFGLDLRGHGLSDGRRGDYPNRARFEKDLAEATSFLKGRFSRVVGVGHSLGTLCAIAAYNTGPVPLDGLVLLSAAREIRGGAYGKPTAGPALKALLGIALFHGSRLIEYNRPGMLGRQDPLFNFHFSARFYASLYATSAWTVVKNLSENKIDSPHLTLLPRSDVPILVGVGDQDELFSVGAVRAFFEALPTPRKEFFIVPGARHASFPPTCWGPVVAWLVRHFPTGPRASPPT